MKRFELDAEQADAILELKLYRLARLEILVIQNELAEKRKRARQISSLLKDEEGRWTIVRDEIQEVQGRYAGKGDTRRTTIEAEEEVSFTADDFIVEEDNVVIVSRDGWLKRQKEVRISRPRGCARGMRCWPCCRAAHVRPLCCSRILSCVYPADHRCARVHRLRRACPEVVQASGRRARHSGIQPRPPRHRQHYGTQRGRAASRARAGGHERRLQPAIQFRAVRGSEHASRSPICASCRRRRGGWGFAHYRRRGRHRRNPRRAGILCAPMR